jgi:hypothetical protein
VVPQKQAEGKRRADMSRQDLDKIYEIEGYKAAREAADKMGIIWFASAGAKRKPREG